mmetsp:Transcript_32123/g.59808  ORF Transcript_32123/g.59808 Transcript_32123/m.59808 type:complete len:127 (-) Transcript_32123:20-400(-)
MFQDILFSVLLSIFTILGEIVFLFVNPLLILKKSLTAKKKTYTSVLITGASQGIGAELAKLYAKPGVNLYLVARNKEKLEKVKAECKDAAKVTVMPASVDDAEAMKKLIAEADAEKPLDLVIANAG